MKFFIGTSQPGILKIYKKDEESEIRVLPIVSVLKNISKLEKNMHDICCFVSFYAFSDHANLRTFWPEEQKFMFTNT